MKKRFWSAVMAVITISSLVACGASGTVATETSAPDTGGITATGAEKDISGEYKTIETVADLSKETLVWGTDAVGASTYNIGVEMSKVLEANGIGMVDVSPTSPGGMGAPYLFEGDQGIDIAFVNGAPAKWARETGTLGKPPVSGSYKALMGGLSGVCTVNLMTRKFAETNGITSLDEVFEKKLPIRIGCSNVGSMDAECVNLMLEYYGIDEETLKSWGGSVTHGAGSDISDMMADGNIDFYLDHTSQNGSTVAEIAMTQDVIFNQWSEDMIDWFIKEKGFQRVTIPAGSFKGQDQDIIWPGSPDCIFVKADMSDDLAYTITKVLCENRDLLASKYESLNVWDVSKAWESERIGGNELHPGAEKYYKEAGYIK